IRNRKTVLGNRKTVLGNRKTVLGNRKTVLGNRKTVLGNRKTVLGNRTAGPRHNPTRGLTFEVVQRKRRRETRLRAHSTQALFVTSGRREFLRQGAGGAEPAFRPR